MSTPPHDPSLRRVAEAIARGEDGVSVFRGFADALIRVALIPSGDGRNVLRIPPGTFSDPLPWIEDPVRRVHLGGMAEHLARMSGCEPPGWCEDPSYFLPEPFFMGGSAAHAHMLETTPSAFRRRLLFCGPVLEKMTAMVSRNRS